MHAGNPPFEAAVIQAALAIMLFEDLYDVSAKWIMAISYESSPQDTELS